MLEFCGIGKRDGFDCFCFARVFVEGRTFCGVCGVRADDSHFGLMVCALAELSRPVGINKIPILDG